MTENDLTPDYIAERVERLQGESAFAILSKANELEAKGMNVIHLEIGQPDFKTPENIIDAAKEAMSDGYTGYGPTLGYNELREAVADYVKEYKNIDATKDNVVIVPGGKPTMFFTMLTLVEPGDEVIYPNRDSAEKLAVRVSNDNLYDYVELDNEYSIYEIPALRQWLGKTIKQINIRAAFHIYIIGIKKDNKTDFLPSVDYVFNIEDHLLVIGKKKDVDMILKCMS